MHDCTCLIISTSRDAIVAVSSLTLLIKQSLIHERDKENPLYMHTDFINVLNPMYRIWKLRSYIYLLYLQYSSARRIPIQPVIST